MLCQTIGGLGAQQLNALAQLMCVDGLAHLVDVGVGSIKGADQIALPRQRCEARQRLDQQILALARGDRGDAEQARRSAAVAARQLAELDAGFDDGDLLRRYGEVGQTAGGVDTGDDHVADGGQSAGFADAKALLLGRPQAGFVGERMMDQCRDRQTRGVTLDDRRQAAHGEPVDHGLAAVGQGGQGAVQGVGGDGIRLREAPVKPDDIDLPAAGAQGFDDSCVVDVAAGQLAGVAGNDKREVAHRPPS